MEDGFVLKGTRIVIPAKKHEAVLKLIHENHLGLNKFKLCARILYTGQDWMNNLKDWF